MVQHRLQVMRNLGEQVLNQVLREGCLKVQASMSRRVAQGKHHKCRPPLRVAQGAHVPVQTPGGSSGLEASTGRLGTVSSDALPGGIVDAGDSHVEGFVTPRSQHGLQHQGLPTITEMVEGFPASGRQLMTRVGEFFRVARTEVMQVPTVWQDTHVTPPRSTSQSQFGCGSGAFGLGRGEYGFT